MAAPTTITTIPRDEPGGSSPRPPGSLDLAEPALATDDDALPWDDGDGDGAFAGAPLVQLAQFQPGSTQPDAGPSGEPRLDERYRIAQAQRQQESDLDWLMRFTGGYPQPQAQQQPVAAPTAGATPVTPPQPAAPDTGRGVLGAVGDVADEARRWIGNLVSQIPGGFVVMGGSAIQAPDVLAAAKQIEQQRSRRRMLELADAIDRGETPLPSSATDAIDAHLGAFVAAYGGMTPEQRQAERTRVQQEIANNVPTAIAERSLYQAGERVKEWARSWIPHVEGYDANSWSSMIGAGLGSLIAGIPVSLATGPVGGGAFFAGVGVSEATERAIQFDKQQRSSGGQGLTVEQIALAGLAGVIPGATDIAPVEVLLSRLKLPGMTPQIQRTLAQAIARAGGAALVQAGVEGLQEGLQQAMQNLIAQGYNPQQLLSEGVLQNIIVGTAVGGIAGGVMGGGVRPEGAAGQDRSAAVPTELPWWLSIPRTPAIEQILRNIGATTSAEAAVRGATSPPIPGQQPSPLPQAAQPSPLQQMLDLPPDAPLVSVVRLSLGTLAVGRAAQ
jgi:hypothetical protein